MKKILCLIFLVLISINHVLAETLFRWKDKDGKVHYGDRPASDAISSEAKRFGSEPAASEDDLPYSIRKAKQDFPVTLYVSKDCGDYCIQARSFLKKRGIPFAEKTLSSKEEVEAFKLKTGGEAIPTLTVGKTILQGWESGQWNSELDLAGYPKSAPYGVRPAQQAPVKNTETEKVTE